MSQPFYTANARTLFHQQPEIPSPQNPRKSILVPPL